MITLDHQYLLGNLNGEDRLIDLWKKGTERCETKLQIFKSVLSLGDKIDLVACQIALEDCDQELKKLEKIWEYAQRLLEESNKKEKILHRSQLFCSVVTSIGAISETSGNFLSLLFSGFNKDNKEISTSLTVIVVCVSFFIFITGFLYEAIRAQSMQKSCADSLIGMGRPTLNSFKSLFSIYRRIYNQMSRRIVGAAVDQEQMEGILKEIQKIDVNEKSKIEDLIFNIISSQIVSQDPATPRVGTPQNNENSRHRFRRAANTVMAVRRLEGESFLERFYRKKKATIEGMLLGRTQTVLTEQSMPISLSDVEIAEMEEGVKTLG